MASEDKRRQKEVMKQISNWFEDLKKTRQKWEVEWYEISKFLDPKRETLFKNTDEVKVGKYIFDGTPISAHRLLVDGLMGYLISPSLPWFRLRMGNRKLEQLEGVKLWLQQVEKHFYSLFRRSNFYGQMYSLLEIGSSYGTATMYFEEKATKKIVSFKTLHPMEAYISTDSDDKPNAVFRLFKMKARNILERFDKEQIRCEILEMLEKSPEEKYKILHAVFPRTEREIGKLTKTNKQWASYYILWDHEEMLSEGGYDAFPYVVWWWEKNSYEDYGRSPAWEALADIKGLNQMGRTLLEAANKAVEPPLNVPARLKGMVRIKPNGINYIESPDERIEPINLVSGYPVGVDREERKQEAIKKHFRVEFFLMLANATRRMTAYEVAERQAEKAALLESPITRLGTDVLNPIFDRIFEIEWRAGRIPPPPPSLAKYSGEELEVDYVGPLAQAQKRLFRTQGTDRFLERAIPIIQINPEVADNVDWDQLIREYMEADNVPQEIVVPEDKVAKMRELRNRMKQLQAQLQLRQQEIENYQKLAKAPEEGSPVGAEIGPAEGE